MPLDDYLPASLTPTQVLATASAVIAGAAGLAYYLRSDAVPGPMFTLPLIGETNALIKEGALKFFWTRFVKYGPVYRTSLLGYDMYLVADHAFTKEIHKGSVVEFMVPGRAFHAIINDLDHINHSDHHLSWRKSVNAALGPSAQDAMIPQLRPMLQQTVAQWAAKGEFPLYSSIFDLSLDFSASGVVTGIYLAPETQEWAKERYRLIIKGLYGMPVNLPGSDLRKGVDAKNELLQRLGPELEPQVARILEQQTADAKAAGAAGKASDDKPLSMLEAQLSGSVGFKPITREVIVERAIGNVIAASDATRSLLLGGVIMVARSARVQEKLLQEQRQVVAKHGDALSYSTLNRDMPYLDAVVKETARLLIPSNGGFRRATQDLTVGRHVIPKGAYIWWSTHLSHTLDAALSDGKITPAVPIHMDYVDHFDEAFQPERWLPGGTKPTAYIPFGSGAHMCPGMNLAYTETKLLLVELLRNYDIKLSNPDILRTMITFPGIKPSPGTDGVRLTPRKL